MKTNHMYHQPCGRLEEIPDSSVHVIITSPPYNLGHTYQAGKNHNLNGYDAYDDRLPEDEYQDWQMEVLEACGHKRRIR